MTTTFQIPRILKQYSRGRSDLRLQGSTVRVMLQELQREYPGLYQCICDETGTVRQHLNLFLNDELLRDLNGLDTRVSPGDVVSVFQAVSGG